MKTKILAASVFLCLLFTLAFLPGKLQADDAPKAKPPAVYDESADGARQISDALAMAGKQDKRVLLQFGANWCGWCKKLHALFESDKTINELLKTNYVVALIDVNNGHNGDLYKKYAAESSGIPFIVILDSNGNHLITQHTAVLEEGDHHSPEKVLAFLKEWAPKR